MLGRRRQINMVYPDTEIGDHLAFAACTRGNNLSIQFIRHGHRHRIMALHGGDHLFGIKGTIVKINRHIKGFVKGLFSGLWPPSRLKDFWLAPRVYHVAPFDFKILS